MMNPTSISFERNYNSDPENIIFAKMIVEVEETNVETYYLVVDENGHHSYRAQFQYMNFTNAFIPVLAELFETYTYVDDSVTTEGWECVHNLKMQLSNMF